MNINDIAHLALWARFAGVQFTRHAAFKAGLEGQLFTAEAAGLVRYLGTPVLPNRGHDSMLDTFKCFAPC